MPVYAPRLTCFANGGRLTTESGVAVSTADRTGQGTVYWTPHAHGDILLPATSAGPWLKVTPGEKSLALAVASGSNYDVFGYLSSGTLALELSSAWSSDTARNDALGTLDGVRVKNSDKTRLYLGTLRASGSNVTADAGSPASGTSAKRFLWNAYNRVPRPMRVIEAADTWAYTTAAWRSANNSTANRFEFVLGLSEEFTFAEALCLAGNSGGVSNNNAGVGLDRVNGNDAQLVVSGSYAANANFNGRAVYRGHPGIGYHFLQWLEYTDAGSGTTTWFGDAGVGYIQLGMHGEVWG